MPDKYNREINYLRRTSDGKLRACLLSETEVDFKKSLREHCSDSEPEELIRDAVLLKSKQHGPIRVEEKSKKCCRNMSEIGG